MSSGYISSIRTMSLDAWKILFAWFAGMGFSEFGIFTVVFNLYVLRLGISPEFLGILLSFQAISSASLAIPFGILGSRFGSKRILIAGTIIWAIGLTGLWLSGGLSLAHARISLPLSMIAIGTGASACLSNTFPMLASVTTPENRSVGFTLLALAQSLGGLIGSFVGGWFLI